MKSAYMPFTYLPEATAHLLSSLVGPVRVYKPATPRAGDDLTALADQGIIDIRTPFTGDEQRLRAALNEFTQWAAQNPGHATAGAGFVGAQQGKIPFFDETSINRIRSEIKAFQKQPDAKDQEVSFSARLFLAVAEDNDRTTATLDQNLKQFKSLEQGFLESLVDGDEADFKRRLLGGGVWREDPGARQTMQRIRAWACLAVADDNPPDCLITTSRAVMESLIESVDQTMAIQQVAAIRCTAAETDRPLLNGTLTDLMGQDDLSAGAGEAFAALNGEIAEDGGVAVTIYATPHVAPADLIAGLAPDTATRSDDGADRGGGKHTFILLVESGSNSV